MKLPVSEIFEFVRNGLSVQHELDSGGLPITRIETIAHATINLERVGYAGISLADAKQYILQDGDILFSHINSVSHLGKCAIYNKELGSLVHGMNLLCFRVKSEKLHPKFALYLIRSNHFKSQLAKSIKKSVNQASVSTGDIKKIILNIPSLAEQQRIAALLDAADRILKQRESGIAKLDQLAQSVFVAMFSNIEHITTLSQVAELKRGPFGGALKKEIFVKHGPMVYEQRNAIYDDCKNGKYFITEEKFNEMKDFSVIDNDLIVSCSGTLGKVAKIDKESPRGIINQALLRVRPKKNISSSFLKSAIESVSVQRNLAISSHGSGLQNFPPMAVVKAVPIPLPSFELQMKFESIKEEILKKKIDLINSKNNLENLLKSLQHQSFAVS